MAMFNIPFFGGNQPAPASSGNPQVDAISNANIEAAKKRRMAEMLDGISYNKADARSPAEGYSKIFTAVVGGRAHNAADEAEQTQRTAMAAMLEGASPLERGVFATGDKNMQNTVVQQRLAQQRDAAKPNPVLMELTKRKAIADASGYPKDSAEYREIITNGNVNVAARFAAQRDANKPDPAQAEVLKRKAIAAASGFTEGTPEYQQLMANGRLDSKTKSKARQFGLKEIDALTKQGQEIANQNRFTSSWSDKYAGKGGGSGTLAELENMWGSNSPIASKDAKAGANWWRDYKKSSELVERHGLFGAALTATEQAQWQAADINPAMQPDQIRKNMELRSNILRNKIQSKAAAMTAEGYSPETISAAWGFDISDPQAMEGAVAKFAAPAKIQGALPPEAAAAAPATESGGTPAQPASAGVPAATIPDIGSLPPAALEGLKAGKGVKIGGKIYRLGEGGALEEYQ